MIESDRNSSMGKVARERWVSWVVEIERRIEEKDEVMESEMMRMEFESKE
jgi:hypothetical protein